MIFDNLFKDCECDCLAESFECQQKFIYLRKLNKAEVEEKDFLTHWERGKEPETNECDHVCGFRGISIDLLEEDSEQTQNAIINRYRTTFKINPRKGSYCLRFKFKSGSGNIKHTPFDGAETHHDLYKSDEFQINTHIDQLAIIHFNESDTN